ncbi:hypothetical protein [Xanthobacter autotrophicus]|uniref:hypothetical protein n=1 Tax=Xanthobacter autotrophicus TaxID=280 RepID=UPI00372CE31E
MTCSFLPAARLGTAAFGRNIRQALTSRMIIAILPPALALIIPDSLAALVALSGGAA